MAQKMGENSMEIIFVRHGVPDYRLPDERNMSQLEKDYAPLDRKHIPEIIELSSREIFEGAEVVISSPYTRALQTAELLNRKLQLDLYVEHDLREWQADLSGGYIDLLERDRRWAEYRYHLKNALEPTSSHYESFTHLKARALGVLQGYSEHKKVIVVSHFNVFESLLGYQDEGISCGEYKSFNLNEIER
jgi:broad specificity phosphatase PhoE